MRPANGGVAPVPGRVSEEFPAVVSIGHIEDDRHARCDPVVHGLALPVRHLGDIAVGIIVAGMDYGAEDLRFEAVDGQDRRRPPSDPWSLAILGP